MCKTCTFCQTKETSTWCQHLLEYFFFFFFKAHYNWTFQCPQPGVLKWVGTGRRACFLLRARRVLLTVSSSFNLCKARTPLSGGRSQPIFIRAPAPQTTPSPPAPPPWSGDSLRGPVGPCQCMRRARASSPITPKGRALSQRRLFPPCNPSHLM